MWVSIIKLQYSHNVSLIKYCVVVKNGWILFQLTLLLFQILYVQNYNNYCFLFQFKKDISRKTLQISTRMYTSTIQAFTQKIAPNTLNTQTPININCEYYCYLGFVKKIRWTNMISEQ